jgi:hypothetical protein
MSAGAVGCPLLVGPAFDFKTLKVDFLNYLRSELVTCRHRNTLAEKRSLL